MVKFYLGMGNMMTDRLFIVVLLLQISACSIFKNASRQIEVISSPHGASVSVLSKTGNFAVIGKTPLLLDEKLIGQWIKDGNEYIILRLEKSGHAVENLFVDLNSRHRLNFTATLKSIDVWNLQEAELSSANANKLTTKIQQINQFVLKKDFESALKRTDGLMEQFPKAHVFLDMKGSIYLLMGRRQEALASYQKSLQLNPDNSDAIRAIERLKESSQ
jgi:tetratricopeptide (TPR) repeat protein